MIIKWQFWNNKGMFFFGRVIFRQTHGVICQWLILGWFAALWTKVIEKKWHENLHIHSGTIALSCLAPINCYLATVDDLTCRPDLRRQLLFCSAGSLIRRKLWMPRLQPPASARPKAEFWRDFGSLRWQSFVDNVARCRPGPWLVHSLVHSYPMVPPLWLIIIPQESR